MISTEDYNKILKIKCSKKRGKEGSIEYINYAFSFDTETSSFYAPNGDKQCCMYLWGFGYGSKCYVGRTWGEFIELMEELSRELNLSPERRIIVFVHNLGYDFQFFRKHLSWYKVFSIKEREPLCAVTTTGIEFRDSYLLSGLSLSKTAETLRKHDVKKMVGDLDYDLIRHCETPISDKEMGYMINDCLVVTAYIEEQIEQYKNIAHIPFTKTGKVRKWCKDYIMHHPKKWNYVHLMEQLTLDMEDYKLCKEAYAGGFSHANANRVGEVLDNVESFDFTSSYPAVMCSELFPMSKPYKIRINSVEELKELSKKYSIIFNCTFRKLESKIVYEHYISYSKCLEVQIPFDVDNGRLVSAEAINITITDVDYWIIERAYTWDSIEFGRVIAFKKLPLPAPFLECIYHFYEGKTELKGVQGKEEEYQNLKEMLNSLYGMCVTDIVRDDWIYDLDKNEWAGSQVSKEGLEEYNNKRSRFLYYPWGVFITAYARRNLWTGIFELKNDYIYSDTDSLKVLNYEKHKSYFDNYNKWIVDKLQIIKEMSLCEGNYCPKTIKGEEKYLGTWDREHSIKKFKTLGAKRYLCYYGDNEYMLTIAGLSKSNGIDYLKEKYNNVEAIFEAFTKDLFIPEEYTGKKTHTYIDNEMVGYVTDYLGNKCIYHELSGIHLSNCSFSLSLSDKFLEFLLGIENVYI